MVYLNGNDAARLSKNEQLLWACRRGNAAMARKFIEEGADITATDQSLGLNPLMNACRFHKSDIALLLLDNGAKINALSKPGELETCGNRTALHFACEIYNSSSSLPLIENILELLLGWGADPSMVDDEGNTAIDLARRHMPPSVVSMLEQRCSVLSRELDYYSDGAHKKVHVEVLEVMLEPGSTHGAYRHEMVWRHEDGSHQVLSLLESTVHDEDDELKRPTRNTTKRYTIVLRSHGNSDNPVTRHIFSVKAKVGSPVVELESQQDMVDLSRDLRKLCGVFTTYTRGGGTSNTATATRQATSARRPDLSKNRSGPEEWKEVMRNVATSAAAAAAHRGVWGGGLSNSSTSNAATRQATFAQRRGGGLWNGPASNTATATRQATNARRPDLSKSSRSGPEEWKEVMRNVATSTAAEAAQRGMGGGHSNASTSNTATRQATFAPALLSKNKRSSEPSSMWWAKRGGTYFKKKQSAGGPQERRSAPAVIREPALTFGCLKCDATGSDCDCDDEEEVAASAFEGRNPMHQPQARPSTTTTADESVRRNTVQGLVAFYNNKNGGAAMRPAADKRGLSITPQYSVERRSYIGDGTLKRRWP